MVGDHLRALARRFAQGTVEAGVASVVLVGIASAHASNLSAGRESMTIPPWLVLLTGGAVIGASFLLVSMVTDRYLIDAVHEWGWERQLATPGWLPTLGRALGLVVLVAIVVVGFVGPQTPTVSLTILFVWVAWWAGYAISVYLLGDTWGWFNPWRLVADLVPVDAPLEYPDRLGAWPSIAGLFALVWLEVTSPIANSPRLMATVVAVYSGVTVLGALLFGGDRWFREADPVSRVFRFYGLVAPIQGVEGRVATGLPGWRLTRDQFVHGWDDVAFVVGLLWLTTYDGFVATPSWKALADVAVGVGLPPMGAYFALFAGGYGLFILAYMFAVRVSRRFAVTLLDERTVALRFAQSLVPIAAGYHLAHYLGYFLELGPSVAVMATHPLTPPASVPVLVLPGWFGTVQLFFVLVGHVVAIWIAHAIAFETFTGRLQPIRSQYSFSLIMVGFTMVSIAIVYQPTVALPYL
ncbi:MAG: hypothetical protein ABEJ59_00690 [Halanaeroarchaeum sp.]